MPKIVSIEKNTFKIIEKIKDDSHFRGLFKFEEKDSMSVGSFCRGTAEHSFIT